MPICSVDTARFVSSFNFVVEYKVQIGQFYWAEEWGPDMRLGLQIDLQIAMQGKGML